MAKLLDLRELLEFREELMQRLCELLELRCWWMLATLLELVLELVRQLLAKWAELLELLELLTEKLNL